MNELTPEPQATRLLKSLAFLARWTLALLLLAWVLFAASWGTLHLVIVPRIGELRPQLEAAATRLIGVPVRIESITGYSTNLLPAFELGNVRLLDPRGREALRLPRVLVSLSPRALLNLKFDQVLVDSPVLDVRRLSDGRIQVAGLDLSQGSAVGSDDAVLDAIFSQPEFVIRHGQVVWTDEMRAVPPLALSAVDVVLRNRARVHEMRLDATPPSEWGERFGLRARFEQPFLARGDGRWKEWTGQVYADFARIDLAQFKRYVDRGFDVDQGQGAVRAWVDIQRAQVTGATADIALADMAVRLAPDLEPLQLASVSGRLSGKFAPDAREFVTQGLAFDTRDGIHWPGGNLSFKQQLASAARPATGDLQADRLDLAALAQIAGRLPLDTSLRAALGLHRPSGQIDKLRLRWQQAVGQASTYQAEGRMQQLSVRAAPDTSGARRGTPESIGTPGVQGISAEFSFSESGGKAALLMQDGSVDLPGVFEEALVPFGRLSGDLSWQVRGDKLQVQLARLRFANADADGELELKWQTSDPARSASKSRFPGMLDMQGKLTRANATRVHRYLPLVLEPEVRNYVRDAVQAGTASDVRFKVRGDLWDLPFPDARQGEFLVSAQIGGATLAYVPRSLQPGDAKPWPAATRLTGTLVIDRQSLMVRGANSALAGSPMVQITKADALIADLAKASVVAVNLEARGPLSELLAFANNSPIASMTEQALAPLSGTGEAELRLKLEVPIDDPDRTRVQGSLQLQGNDVQVSPDLPRLARARGAIGFTENGVSVNALQARWLGGDVRIDGGTVPPSAAVAGGERAAPAMGFRLQGTASAEGLRQAREFGFVPRIAQYLMGSAAYSASVGWRSGLPDVAVNSTLVGMALNLPVPLGKPAEAALPLRLEFGPARDASGALVRQQDQWLVQLGRVASARYLRDTTEPEPRVLRGAIAVGLAEAEPPALPREGVTANIRLDTVDVDAWDRLLPQFPGSVAEAAGAKQQPSASAADSSYWPTNLALRARNFTASGRTLHDLVAGGSREGGRWRANLEARELNGYLEYQQPNDQGAGRLYARLSRLTLAGASANEVESLLSEQPQSIPALDIVVEEFDLRGKKLGRVEVEAVNRAVAGHGAVAREWRLNRFDVIAPDAVFRATGNWAALNAQTADAGAAAVPARGGKRAQEQRRTVMNFQLDIQNAGELLARLGMKDVVRRGKGQMQGQIAWAGSPLSLDYASLGGNFKVNIENGQFLKAEPGLAKLLGVLSLQSLPRRLMLDFRDVFSEGFAFDFFRGDVRIDQGIAHSDNLQMKGINAAVLMDGQADLSRETQNIRVLIVPEINAGTASLIAAAINPAVGLGTILAQFVLRQPLIDAATQEIHIDGSWVEPRIRRAGAKTGTDGNVEPTAPSAVNR